MADAHHHAARGDERSRREPELVSSESRPHDDVAAGAKAAVDLEPDAVSQPVLHEHLMCLGQPQLPRQAGVLDRAERSRPGASVVAGDDDVLGLGLRDSGGDRAHAGLGDELDRDLCAGVDALQVVDELGEVLDRVDVVVRRWGDQAHAGERAAQVGNLGVHLGPRELSALAGLGALGDLDLELVGVDEVGRRHAEAP